MEKKSSWFSFSLDPWYFKDFYPCHLSQPQVQEGVKNVWKIQTGCPVPLGLVYRGFACLCAGVYREEHGSSVLLWASHYHCTNPSIWAHALRADGMTLRSTIIGSPNCMGSSSPCYLLMAIALLTGGLPDPTCLSSKFLFFIFGSQCPRTEIHESHFFSELGEA